MALKGEAAVVQRHRALLDRLASEMAAELYGPDGMPWGTLFSELEDDAYELGQAMARRLVQEMVRDQAEANVPEGRERCQCGHPLETPDEDDEEAWQDRDVLTRSGHVSWSEPQRYCPKCRKAFFPSVEGVGDQSGRVQPGRAAEGDLCGDEGGVRSGQ